MKAAFTSELSKATSYKQRFNFGATWDNFIELKHKVNDNLTVGISHKYHSCKQGVKDKDGKNIKATEIGMSINYKL